jgi:checkpoint serine/threonine-protein kinase
MDELGTGPKYSVAALDRLKLYVTECIEKYGDDYQYSTDPRLLKVWILYVSDWFLMPILISTLLFGRFFIFAYPFMGSFVILLF